MRTTEQADCVIVGAGIGGAVLALALGRHGHRVLILEREPTLQRLGRPEILARSTVEAFERLGLDARLHEQAIMPLKGLAIRDPRGHRLLTITEEDITQAGVQPYSTDPAETRRLLIEQAQAAGSVQVRRGVEVLELVRNGSWVRGVRARTDGEVQTYAARLVIGDDGGRSRVRAALGIPLPLRPFPVDFLVPAQPIREPSPPVGRAWLDPAGLAGGFGACIVMPLPAGRSAMAVVHRPRLYDRLSRSDVGQFQQAAARLGSECAALMSHAAFPGGWVPIRRPFGHAARYVADGAALLGDAAHPVTPAGGQGANMSVADALVLAEVAHEALVKGDCSAASLQPYEDIRRPANARSLQFSRIGKRFLGAFSALPGFAQAITWLIRRNDRPEQKRRLLRAAAGAFVSSADTRAACATRPDERQ